jgi:predicted dehydrogenase
MKTYKLKVLIIGLGKMGIAHAAILNRLENIELISFVEPDKKISNVVERLGFPGKIFKNINDAQNAFNIDVIFITCPTQFHYEYIEFAINNNIPYFVEKPACTSTEHIKMLMKLPNFQKTKGMVGYMMRFMPTFKRLKYIIDSKLLGDINIINCSMNVSQVFSKGSGWRYKKEYSGGGVVATQGIHLIDLLYWYFGSPKGIHSFLNKPYSIDVEDTASILFDFEKFGITTNISWSSHEKRLLETTINIQGDRGSIYVDDDTIEIYLKEAIDIYSQGWTVTNKTEISECCHFDIGAPAYALQDKYFIDSIIENSDIDSDLTTSLAVQTILEGVYK